MEFKGNIVGVSDALICIVCNNPSYQFEQLQTCELSFCNPECQQKFWDEIYWDLEEEECESGNLFQRFEKGNK
jgi:hypothetical protein